MSATNPVPVLSDDEVEIWRRRAQSLIDWRNGVPGSVAFEGEFLIETLLQNMPPEIITSFCATVRALRKQVFVAVRGKLELDRERRVT